MFTSCIYVGSGAGESKLGAATRIYTGHENATTRERKPSTHYRDGYKEPIPHQYIRAFSLPDVAIRKFLNQPKEDDKKTLSSNRTDRIALYRIMEEMTMIWLYARPKDALLEE